MDGPFPIRTAPVAKRRCSGSIGGVRCYHLNPPVGASGAGPPNCAAILLGIRHSAGMSVRETVRDPHGEEYELTAERAPRVEFWIGSPHRLWNTVTRSNSWWLTVHGERYVWPLIRESFSSEPEAEGRLRELKEQIRAGSARLGSPALRRRRH